MGARKGGGGPLGDPPGLPVFPVMMVMQSETGPSSVWRCGCRTRFVMNVDTGMNVASFRREGNTIVKPVCPECFSVLGQRVEDYIEGLTAVKVILEGEMCMKNRPAGVCGYLATQYGRVRNLIEFAAYKQLQASKPMMRLVTEDGKNVPMNTLSVGHTDQNAIATERAAVSPFKLNLEYDETLEFGETKAVESLSIMQTPVSTGLSRATVQMSDTPLDLTPRGPHFDQQTHDDMEAISNALEGAERYGLQAEVIYSALGSMQANPGQTISQAITTGFNEWVK